MDWTKKDLMWLWFVNIPGIGYRTRKKLLQLCTTPEQLYREKVSALSDVLTERMREAFETSKRKQICWRIGTGWRIWGLLFCTGRVNSILKN